MDERGPRRLLDSRCCTTVSPLSWLFALCRARATTLRTAPVRLRFFQQTSRQMIILQGLEIGIEIHPTVAGSVFSMRLDLDDLWLLSAYGGSTTDPS